MAVFQTKSERKIYQIKAENKAVNGMFTREIDPVLTIESGDTVQYQTLDVRWGYADENGKRVELPRRDDPIDQAHALSGPVWIKGAQPGMTLEVRINELIPAPFGFTLAGGRKNWQNEKLDLTKEEEIKLDWSLNTETMTGTCQVGGKEISVPLNPFLGIIGMPPDEPGLHHPVPPRYCGGNMDCRELVKGSVLYLPISVEGALVSVGDGHAAQGDGEVSLTAIECPMDLAEVTYVLREDIELKLPRAKTPAGWVTMGFHEDLNEATVMALDGMLDLMGELYGLSRVEAMAIGSSVISLRITQIVNGVKGVHALLPHGSVR